MTRRLRLLTTPPTPPRKGEGEKQPNACAGHVLARQHGSTHESRRLALVAIAAAAVRFSTPSLA
jgi:hypothetical protein